MSFISLKRSVFVFGICAVAAGAMVPTSLAAKNKHGDGCPRHLERRSPEETINEHIALLNAGKLDEAMCDYAPDAVVILPGQIAEGRDAIRAGLEGIGSLLGGVLPTVTSITTHGSTVLLTLYAYGTPCIIPDGSDTYIVRHGRIVTQTVHDTLYDAPGAVCPVASPLP